MNATILVLSSALGMGADVVPAGWGEKPPVVIQAGGCHGCGASNTPTVVPYSPAPAKVGLLDRLRARCGKSSSSCCAPAPAPACDPCATSTSGYSQPNLLDRLRSRCQGRKAASDCCNPCGQAPGAGVIVAPPGCATPLPTGMQPVTPGTGDPPKVMDKPKDPVKDPKTGTGGGGGTDTKPKDPKAGGTTTAPDPKVVDPKPVDPKPLPPKGTGGVSVPEIPASPIPNPITLPPIPTNPGAAPKVASPNSPY